MKEEILCSVNSDYNNDIHSWVEIERQLTNIAKAGFTHIEWVHDWEGEYIYSPSEMFQARDILRDLGIKAHTIHATEGGRRTVSIDGKKIFQNRYRLKDIRKDYTSLNEYTRLAGVDLLKNRIDLCSHIGADVMVLHLQIPWKLFEERPEEKGAYFKAVMRSFDELQPYAKAAGIRIALENVIATPWQIQDEMLELMFNRYDEEFMGFAFDSGHATLQCRHDYYYFLRKYYERMYATHLQENNSIEEKLADDDSEILAHDTHWVPMDPRGKGILDWVEIAKWIAKAPLNLPADFEVVIYGDTPEDEFKQLVACRETAQKFQKMVLEEKKKQ